jgi:hypothetical protein
VASLIGIQDAWRGQSVEECLKVWCNNYNVKSYKALPLIIARWLWLVRNDSLSKNISTMQITSQGMNILRHLSRLKFLIRRGLLLRKKLAYFDGGRRYSM